MPEIFNPSGGGAGTSAARLQETQQGWIRTGAFAENYSRMLLTNTDVVIAGTGVLYVFAGPKLYVNEVATSVKVVCSAASVGLTHSWFALIDTSLNVLAKTTDVTSDWAAGEQTGTFSSPYTVLTSAVYYIGLMVTAATTMPVVRGQSTWATAATLTPRLTAFSTTGLTTPASLGGTAAALTTNFASGLPWCAIS